MEYTNCIICGESDNSQLIQVSDRLNLQSDEIFQIVECTCGLIYLNPRPTELEIINYYENENYDPHKRKKLSLFNIIYRIVQKYSFNKKLKIINKFVDGKGLLIDIGGGTGDFCKFMTNSGWDTILQDNSETALSLVNSKNILTINSMIDLVDQKPVDLFTFWHSLEHIHNIPEIFSMVNRHLKNNKYIIIAVPNNYAPEKKFYNEIWAPWDAPRHLYHFSKSTLTKLLLKYNIEPIYWKSLPQDTPYNILLSMKKYSISSLLKGFFVLLYSWMVNLFKGVESSSSFMVVCKKH